MPLVRNRLTRNATAEAFASSRDHLRSELALLELSLKGQISGAMRPSGAPGPVDEFAGLYVSEEEILQYLGSDGGEATCEPSQAQRELDRRLQAARAVHGERLAVDASSLRLPLLARRFGLTDTEVRILLLCLAADVDVRFHKCFAFLQNDVGKKRPSVQFLARMCDGLQDVLDVGSVVGPTAPLVRHRLLELPAGKAHALPVQQPSVPNVVLDFLCERDRVDDRLLEVAVLGGAPEERYLGSFGNHHSSIHERIVAQTQSHGLVPLAYVSGPRGSHRAGLVRKVAAALGFEVLLVRAEALQGRADLPELLTLLSRDARLHGALVHLSGVDGLLFKDGLPAESAGVLRGWLSNHGNLPILLTGEMSPTEVAPELGVPFSGFEIPFPTVGERAEIWAALLNVDQDEGSREAVDGLASKFKFTPGQIQASVRAASRDAVRTEGSAPVVEIEDLHRTSREGSNQRLLSFARKVDPRYRWDDLVLPHDTTVQLQEICDSIRHRRTVYGAWGFDSKFSVGNGLSVLFAGPSGTGKTMSAEVIAGELALDLYKIELSGVVSKYVGETERNLERIFNEAETSNSILFFDEADSLFGKRTEVKDAHDRYANIETNYLLQKLDEYEGIVVLATNFKGNIDPAFTRRLTHVVDYPTPSIELRQRIWRGVFPAEVPFAEDVDLEFLARQFQLSGGYIKNIALNGAFMAAHDGGPVRMAHLVRATKREYEKLGKLCSKSEFGPYMHLIRDPVEGR